MVKKVEKSEEEWEGELTATQFQIARQKGTERAYVRSLGINSLYVFWLLAPCLRGQLPRALAQLSSAMRTRLNALFVVTVLALDEEPLVTATCCASTVLSLHG